MFNPFAFLGHVLYLSQGTKESNGGEAMDPFLHALVMVFAFTPVFTVALLLLPFHGILPAVSQQKGWNKPQNSQLTLS